MWKLSGEFGHSRVNTLPKNIGLLSSFLYVWFDQPCGPEKKKVRVISTPSGRGGAFF